MLSHLDLRTERLSLRLLTADDVDALLTVLGDAETMRFYDRAFSREETRQWIERSRLRYLRDGFALFAVTLLATGELVGDCGPAVMAIDGVDEVEMGWHVRRDLWGRGLATEAAAAVRDWAFDVAGLERLTSLVRPDNLASCRVAEKIGMALERDVLHSEIPFHVFAMTAADRPR